MNPEPDAFGSQSTENFRVDEKNTIPVLYEKLLSLYPRRFRERLGESMLQTFNDLYKERETGNARFGFIL
jgi:hypothetical protein